MFRNQTLQRSIAALVLTTFSTMIFAPLAAAQQIKDAAPGLIGSSPLIPLTPRNTGNGNAALLPIDPQSQASAATPQNSLAPQAKTKSKATLSATQAAKRPEVNSTEAYTRALAIWQDLVKQAVTGTPTALQVNAIRAQYRTIQLLEKQVDSAFAATEVTLRAQGLPAEILQRHQAVVTDYNNRSADLRAAMGRLDAAVAAKSNVQPAIAQLAQWAAQYSSVTGQAQGNAKLPWGNRNKKQRQAALTSRDHERLFPRTIQVATAGSLSGITLPDAILGEAPVPGDLAETDDIGLTPQIRALATSLNNNPVGIYNWVRNNVQYSPGYGAMQGAATTLQAKRGNAFDTASLLIALYRAANIPARYVYGTIEVPAPRIQNWLGVDSIAAAQTLLTQAGIPNKTIVQGGQGAVLQLEHVWVEAYVDYTPSRGAINKAPNTWVPVDPSFKLMQDKAGLNLRAAIGFNEAGLFDAAKQGATCTADSGQGLNATTIQNAYSAYKSQLNTYLAQQGPNLTVGDVLGSQTISAENYSILLGSLPYKTIAQGAVLNVLPDNLRWQFRFQLFADAAAQGQGQATAALTGSLAQLGGKRLTLSFAPASAADAATLALYMPAAHTDGSPIQASEFPADIPGYLIRVKAELRADGQVVASGGNFVLGSELVAELGTFDPAAGNWNLDTIYPHAGDYHAIAIDAQGVSAAQLAAVKARLGATQAALAAGQANTLTRDDVTGDILYHTALAYFATADANSAVFQHAAGVVDQRLPSYGRAVAQAMPQMAFGIVNKVSFPGVVLDIDRMNNAVAVKNGGLDAVAYARQSNERNAAYAHLVLEKLYTSTARPGEAASAVKVLAAAAAQNQPVYAITSANVASLLPQIALNANAKADVQNAAGAGYRILVASSLAAIGAWTGQALEIDDLASGAGDYRLTGDNGGATAALYLPQGMGWLAQAQPFQSAASILPTVQVGNSMDDILTAMLDGGGNTTRWSYFPGQADIANGLFLARLAAAQGTQPCDTLVGIIAAKQGTATGFETGAPSPAASPVITSNPVTAAAAGQQYLYPVIAIDPNNAALTYQLAQAPAGMTVGSTGVIRWNSAVTGSFTVTVRADNGKAYAEQTYLLTVGTEAIPLEISMGVTPPVISVGQTTVITVLTNGGTGPVSKTLTVDGQPVALDAAGQATITGAAMGAHAFTVTATDSQGSITKTSVYSVRNPADTTPPVAQITAPLEDTEITAPVTITGTASDANLAYYQLLLRPSGDTGWQELIRGTASVTNGVLGKLDPTKLANGIYELLLNVVDANGQQTGHLIALDIYRDLKIGQFSITFEDLNVDASGIPIRVTRTYDTRRKQENLDFGYGWSIDYQSVQLRKNMVFGLDWTVVSHPLQLQLCLAPAGKRKINITLPTGKVERFTAANAQECGFVQIPPIDIRFTGLAGTTSQLEIVDPPVYPNVQAQGGQLYDMVNLEIWNPKNFKLTTEDNYIYFITEGIGITQVKDPSGNTLTYGQNGILHSNGQSVAFTRDANNRITAITDPSGKQITYSYGSRGDLTQVTDRTQAVSKFNYNRSHGLTDYTDPRGIVTARYVYDDEGRLIATYDAEGHAIETTHDTANNKEIVKDRRGNVSIFTYDSAGNITEKIDPLGNRTVYTYDANGNELTTTDALGKTITRTFDPMSGKQLTEKDPLGNTMSWEYDPGTRNQLKKYKDARNNDTYYLYAELGQAIQEPLGRTTNLIMGTGGNVSAMGMAGQFTRYTYDTKGNKLTETDAAGNVTSYAYDVNNKEVSRSWSRTIISNGVPQPVNVRTTRKLEAEGRTIEETDVLGNTSKTQYNAGGQVTASIDAQGRQTTFSYDTRGKLAKTTYPDGSSVSITYDADGNQASTTDRQGSVTQYQYDALNRLVKTIAPDGTSTGTEYDAVGRVAVTIDAQGNRFSNTYDDAGRVSEVKDAQGNRIQYGYDANGNRTSLTDAKGKQTGFEYDALNRLVKTTYPDGKFSITVWNVNGTKQSETDQNGNKTEYGYDAVARLNAVTQTNNTTSQVTSYGFDNLGNKTSQTDAEGHVTKWEYDAGNRVASRTLPNGQKETFDYDANGNVKSKTDFNGQSTNYGYNNLNQPQLTIRPDGSRLVTAYTVSGQVGSITVTPGANSGIQGGTTSYVYDAQDRLTKQTNPDGSFLAYGYDASGNIIQRSTGGSAAAGTVTYAYDTNQRLVSVTGSDGKTTSYTYDATGRPVTVVTPNGVTATNTYDDNGRLLQLLHTKAGGIVGGTRYTLASNGQRLTQEEFDVQSTIANGIPANPLRTSAYAYDTVGRLTQDKLSDRQGAVVRTIGYVYDKVGNRTQKTIVTSAGTETVAYTYDSNDRLTQEIKTPATGSPAATTYTWDANGNLKSKSASGQVALYGWNSDNRLIEVRQGQTEATAQTIAKYSYDTNGNRISKIEPGQNGLADKVTAYLVDGMFEYAQMVQETVMQGTTAESIKYLWGVNLIQKIREGQESYYHADGLGSAKVLTDATGNVTDSYEYDAFGNVENHAGTTVNSYRYTGEYFDDKINLQYNRDRWTDLSTGRFIGQDRFSGFQSRPITINKFLYADSDPLNNRDPSGNYSMQESNATMAVLGINSSVSPSVLAVGRMGATQISRSILGSQATTMAGVAIITIIAQTCLRNPNMCWFNIPVLVTGSEMPITSAHIGLAEIGFGSTKSVDDVRPLPFVLNRQPRDAVNYNKEYQCNPIARQKFGGRSTCDEYPFASSRQGGQVNYDKGDVSLQLVPFAEQTPQRDLLGWFYNSSGKVSPDGVSPASIYISVAIPFLPSFAIDRSGKVKKWK